MNKRVGFMGHKSVWSYTDIGILQTSLWKKFVLFKHQWLIVLLLFYYSNLFSRSDFFNSDSTQKLKVIVFYKWGKPDFADSKIYKKCEDSIQNKYGFKYKRVGGCIVRYSELLKWNWHNRRAVNAMRRRHGKQWYENYKSDLNNCCSLK